MSQLVTRGVVLDCRSAEGISINPKLQELIKVSGLQVASAELEAVLLTHPAVADAGVVGIQDSFDALEKDRAYVQLKESGSIPTEEIQEWMKEKVAKYKSCGEDPAEDIEVMGEAGGTGRGSKAVMACLWRKAKTEVQQWQRSKCC